MSNSAFQPLQQSAVQLSNQLSFYHRTKLNKSIINFDRTTLINIKEIELQKIEKQKYKFVVAHINKCHFMSKTKWIHYFDKQTVTMNVKEFKKFCIYTRYYQSNMSLMFIYLTHHKKHNFTEL
jgi:hypothetical protein